MCQSWIAVCFYIYIVYKNKKEIYFVMADVKLELKKNTLSDAQSNTYSATKNADGKSCTIFVNDRTKNGLGKDDYFYYNGDISLFSQKEIKDVIGNGIDGKKYDASNVVKGEMDNSGVKKATKMDNCKDLQEGEYYELGSVLDCADKASKDQTFVKAEVKTEKPAEAPKADTPADKPAAPAPKVASKAPEQTYYDEGYYEPQQGGYGDESPFSPLAGSALCGGVFGGFIGALFGGARGFVSGALGGALGGIMNLFGGGMGGGFACGGYSGGADPMDAALNGVFTGLLRDAALISSSRSMSYPSTFAPMTFGYPTEMNSKPAPAPEQSKTQAPESAVTPQASNTAPANQTQESGSTTGTTPAAAQAKASAPIENKIELGKGLYSEVKPDTKEEITKQSSDLEKEAKEILSHPAKSNNEKALNAEHDKLTELYGSAFNPQAPFDSRLSDQIRIRINEIGQLKRKIADAQSADDSDPKVQEVNTLLSHDLSTYSKAELKAELKQLQDTYINMASGQIKGGEALRNSVEAQTRKVHQLIKQKK